MKAWPTRGKERKPFSSAVVQIARRLDKAGIADELADNAFLSIADFDAAQRLADGFDARRLRRRLQRQFRSGYHWSILQAEYATDARFRRQAEFQPLYDEIVRTVLHSVKAEHVATFLGRNLTAADQGEIGNDFSTRIAGTRIRHPMGPSSIKLYDKFGLRAGVECTPNDVSLFRLRRTVEQRDGNQVWKLAPLRKNIYTHLHRFCLSPER